MERPARSRQQSRAADATQHPRTLPAGQSSVQSMTVAEVRRALSFIRKTWDEQQTDPRTRPFFLSDPIGARSSPQSIESFALMFVLAHHTRRLGSGKACSSSPLRDELMPTMEDCARA